MAGLNNTAMGVAATALKGALLYAQLHSAPAGASGTSNVTTAARQAITWGSTSGAGDFDLSAQLDFTGGASDGAIYSVTLWSASTSGTFYGEFVIAADEDGNSPAFNSSGDFSITSLKMDGSAA